MRSLPFLTAALAVPALVLAACAEQEPARPTDAAEVYEGYADALDNAAEVSHPAAQPVLDNAADDLRDRADAAEQAADEDEEGAEAQ